jgi:hypothetical protein
MERPLPVPGRRRQRWRDRRGARLLLAVARSRAANRVAGAGLCGCDDRRRPPGTDASFGFDQQARVDHAYNAYDKVTLAAKDLIARTYGKGPDHSYFVGCSGGGRQAMLFPQRFPTIRRHRRKCTGDKGRAKQALRLSGTSLPTRRSRRPMPEASRSSARRCRTAT